MMVARTGDQTLDEPTWYSFGEFVLHANRRELLRDGVTVDLGSRATEILLALLRRPGEVATKAAIMSDVWPGLAVAENNLTTQMAQVRRALADPEGRRFIRTVPGRGYRFVAEIVRHSSPPTAQSEPAPPIRHNLPIQSSSFIGRERDLADIAARMNSRALVTIVGAAGVGKTRAALRAAGDHLEQFAEGVLLVELAPLTGSGLVAELLCRKLGAPASSERAPVDTCVLVLRTSRLLLVLDNCEHVLGGVAVLADAILRNCPGVRLLATSREALNVPGEMVFRLPALAVPPGCAITAAEAMQSEAVQLFVQRAGDSLGHYVLTDDDAPAVATICRRLEGVPLAMELAAARLSMMNPAEIAAGLEEMFDLLNVGSRTAEPRHQTLYATIDWSFSLLSPDEQVLLRRLAVFTNGWSLEAAIAVAAGSDIAVGAVFHLMSALVSKSLVVPDTSGPATRYRMLEMTQKYAAEKLAQAGEGPLVHRLTLYLLHLFRQAEASWPTMATDVWLATYGPDAENFRAAIESAFAPGGDPQCGVSLVAVAGSLAEERSMQPDLRRWTQAAIPHLNPETQGAEAASVLYLRTMLHKRLGAHEVPEARLQAIQLFRECGDAVGLSRALRQTAMARAMPGPLDDVVLAMATEAVALLRHLAPHKDLATALAHLGSVHFLAGDHEEARLLNEEAAAMRHALGDRTGMLASSVNLAELLFLDGDVHAALDYAVQAEAEARRRNNLPTLALILSNMAGYRLHDDQLEAAIKAVTEALSLSRAFGQDYLIVMCVEHLALAHALRGNLDLAARGLGFTDLHYRTGGQTRERVEQMGYERLVALLRDTLPPTRLEALQTAGAKWTTEAADRALVSAL